MKHALLFFTGFVFIFIQTLPWNFLFPEPALLNLSFIIVAMAGFHGNSAGSWLLAYVLGFVLESLSGSPRGLISLINLLALIMIRALAGFILFERLFTQVLVLFILCATADLSLLTAAGVISQHPGVEMLGMVVLRSGIVALMGIPLLHFYNKAVRAAER